MRNESQQQPFGLYALCDDGLSPKMPMITKVCALLEGGVRILQMRLKHTPEKEALPMLKEAVALCQSHNAVCLINDRVDWALLSKASGVHVGQEDLPCDEARRLLGPSALIGVTVRNAEMIQAAQAMGASYVGLGPVFETTTKKVNAETLGLSGLAACVSRSPLPVVAIAGIDDSNIEEVAATGVAAAAVGSALYRGDIAVNAKRLSAAFLRGRNRAKPPNLG